MFWWKLRNNLNMTASKTLMDIHKIVAEARNRYGLHQESEIVLCLEFLADKNLNGFVEMGSANGGSFHCWASIIPDGPKVSVDWNRGFGMSPNEAGRWTATEKDYKTVQWRNNNWRYDFSDVRIVEGDCQLLETVEKCSTVLDGDLVDWLFIDTAHIYNEALADYNHYKEFVRSGGYIGFHDICSHEELVTLWADLKLHNSVAAEFKVGHGIGILQRD
jgi:cephalosporin hydroxylase